MGVCKHVPVTRGKKQSFTIFKSLPSPRKRTSNYVTLPLSTHTTRNRKSPIKNTFLNRYVSSNTAIVALVGQKSVPE